MKTRVMFEPWRKLNERYVAEVFRDNDPWTFNTAHWIEIERYGSPILAQECAELFCQGPEVIAEFETKPAPQVDAELEPTLVPTEPPRPRNYIDG